VPQGHGCAAVTRVVAHARSRQRGAWIEVRFEQRRKWRVFLGPSGLCALKSDRASVRWRVRLLPGAPSGVIFSPQLQRHGHLSRPAHNLGS
jgi:hypothetical protein